MNANLVLALLSKHPHLMYIELAVVTPVSPSIANLSYIPKAASLPFSYLVIAMEYCAKLRQYPDRARTNNCQLSQALPVRLGWT
ncbi:Bgt-50957 [Blumeria graminis f. sp. tritici]|uniref:Bgt-50957 n=1 Tax=Blumeria graminis f. sp. tritici TaxID=62690 RepID=A0A9X9PS81_BLUGR|nr:Bgt-50957 [Blumeria graminis f. sp. tritici]